MLLNLQTLRIKLVINDKNLDYNCGSNLESIIDPNLKNTLINRKREKIKKEKHTKY